VDTGFPKGNATNLESSCSDLKRDPIPSERITLYCISADAARTRGELIGISNSPHQRDLIVTVLASGLQRHDGLPKPSYVLAFCFVGFRDIRA
jgi:hypothetical protein